MYSYEDRMRAVELYIKFGKRMRTTIRQLGYPTKNAFKGWHREFERQLEPAQGYAPRKPKWRASSSVSGKTTFSVAGLAGMNVAGSEGHGLGSFCCLSLSLDD